MAIPNAGSDPSSCNSTTSKSLSRKEVRVVSSDFNTGQLKANGTMPNPSSQSEIIARPMNYLLESQGKGFRSKLIAAFNELLHVPTTKLIVVDRVIECLHTASLLIDDIQDMSTLRRGRPVAHRIFGIAQTINSANHAYFLAQKHLEQLENPAALPIFTEELLNLHRGQGMELYWRDSLTCPTEGEYVDMVLNKTGGLFRLAVRLMQLESETDCDLVQLINHLGIIFQVRDDYQNLRGEAYTSNKGFCEDLTEGKFSFPIIHGIHQSPTHSQLLDILRQRPTDNAIKSFAVEHLEAMGSFKHCRRTISRLVAEAKLMAADLGGDKISLVQEILEFLEFE